MQLNAEAAQVFAKYEQVEALVEAHVKALALLQRGPPWRLVNLLDWWPLPHVQTAGKTMVHYCLS